MKTSRHRSLEKYTSHFIWKGCVWEGVGDRTELQHIDPHSYGYNSVSFPFSWSAQLEVWGLSLSGTWSSFQHLLCNCSIKGLRAPSAGCWFSLLYLISNWLEHPVHQVILLFYARSIQPVDSQGYPLDTFDWMHLFLCRCIYYFDSLAGVNMQHKQLCPGFEL